MRKIPGIIGGLMGLIIVLVLYAYYLEPYWIQEKHITIKNGKIPASFSGTKIIFLSDIHFGEFFDKERLERLVARVNKLKPDLILLGGDYVTYTIMPVWKKVGRRNTQLCFEELGKLRAAQGVYAAPGNHDYWPFPELIKKSIKESGIELLENKGVWFEKGRDRIRLGGIGDYWFGEQDIAPVLKGTSPKDFVLLISHNPDYIEELKPGIVDLMLSGHTHGGQFSFFGLWGPYLPSSFGQKYRTGVIKKDTTTLVISNGIGLTSPPVRFFTRPQIIILELKK